MRARSTCISRTSIGIAPIVCAASTSSSAPASRAIGRSSAIGCTAPLTFEPCVIAINFAPSTTARIASGLTTPVRSAWTVITSAPKILHSPQRPPDRVVLHRAGYDLVARPNQAEDGQVQRVGRVGAEGDPLRCLCVDQPGQAGPRSEDHFRRLNRHLVARSAWIRPVLIQRLDDCLANGFRLGPAGSGVVEIDHCRSGPHISIVDRPCLARLGRALHDRAAVREDRQFVACDGISEADQEAVDHHVAGRFEPLAERRPDRA